jgi:hypothetical protein
MHKKEGKNMQNEQRRVDGSRPEGTRGWVGVAPRVAVGRQGRESNRWVGFAHCPGVTGSVSRPGGYMYMHERERERGGTR